MGGVTSTLGSVLGSAGTVLQVANTVASAVGGEASRRQVQNSQDLALQQLQQDQALQEAQIAERAAQDRAELEASARQAEDERRLALRRAVARQRVNFAGSGLSATGGSSDAVLLGLFEESEDERQRREELDNLRSRAIDLGEGQIRANNVLELTQRAETNRLDDLTSGLGVGSSLSAGVSALSTLNSAASDLLN